MSQSIEALLDLVEDRDQRIQALVDEPDRRARLAGASADFVIGVKDIIRVDGLATRAGSRLPPELFDGEEATCVRRLRDAGAVVLAKTVTAEFAFIDPGPTRNPHDLGHTPGGSSSGSAAGVAAGYFPLALGTQTIGSVIRPAAFCGVVGFKPTFGRVPVDGVVPCAPSADTVGMFTPDVATMRRAAAIVVDDWRATPAPERPVLGVPDGRYLACASPAALHHFGRCLGTLAQAGYEVRTVRVLADHDDVVRRHRRMVVAEMARTHAAWFERYGDLYGPKITAAIHEGGTVSDAEIEAARGGRGELKGSLDVDGIDVWICPAAPGPAPAGIESTGDSIMNLAWTHAGMPAITLPAGTIDGLPVGLQCVARAGADESLLGWAQPIASVVG